MGWVELEESQVAPHNMSDTIAECISNLARQRKDLWKTAETWGGVSITGLQSHFGSSFFHGYRVFKRNSLQTRASLRI